MKHISEYLAPYRTALDEQEKQRVPDEADANEHAVCSQCFIKVCECIHN